jgi:hypothetical protein
MKDTLRIKIRVFKEMNPERYNIFEGKSYKHESFRYGYDGRLITVTKQISYYY